MPDDTAYFWFGTLSVNAAIDAHKQRTGRKAQRIICRKTDLAKVAAQLRPEDVELHADNYVQRGTLYLAAQAA